jgi:hypothetical protein
MAGLFTVSTVKWVMLVVLGVGTVLGAAVATRTERRRRLFVLGLAVPASMAVGYLGMANGWLTVQSSASEQSLFRFFGYTVAAVILGSLFRRLADLSQRQFVLLTGVLLTYPWATLVSWVFTGLVETAASVAVLASLVVGAYLLFRPFARAAAAVGGRRYLYYRRLRNHSLLVMTVLVLFALLSQENLGLLTDFPAQLGASYGDLLYAFGICALTYLIADVSGDKAEAHAPRE